MANIYRRRRVTFVCILLVFILFIITNNIPAQSDNFVSTTKPVTKIYNNGLAIDALNKLDIKKRAPEIGYSREQFGTDWSKIESCDMRNIILNRDLSDTTIDDKCNVVSGVLNDPYTGKTIKFKRGAGTSADIQIDHVVALSDAWQKGAQNLSKSKRLQLANDPLELIAVDGNTNMKKGGSDAADWLPPNKSFRCQYVARQIAVKQKYDLWVTQLEFNAIKKVLDKCSSQLLPN